MGNYAYRTAPRSWEIIEEVDRFINANDRENLSSRHVFGDNYYKQLWRLYKINQLLVVRDVYDKIEAVCGWALVQEENMADINKTRWILPDDVENGNILHISFCVSREGGLRKVKQELSRRYGDVVDFVHWFDVRRQRFIHRKNILKERLPCKTAA